MVRARKRFGQHFLEPAWVDKVIRLVGPTADQTFLEIGPGRGALTRSLAPLARHVLAYEIDRDLAAELRSARLANVTVIDADFLTVGVDDVRAALAPTGGLGALRVAGNLPYNVASPMLFRLVQMFEGGLPLVDATVLLQREVAARLAASPGTRDYGVLSILLGMSASVERQLTLPPGAFRPVPKVTSSVVRLRFRPAPYLPSNRRLFGSLIQAVFSQRRKTLKNALKSFPPARQLPPALALTRAGLDGGRRPETLTPAELARLADVIGEALGHESLARRE